MATWQERCALIDAEVSAKKAEWMSKVDALPEEIKAKFKCNCGIHFGEGCFDPLCECENFIFIENGRVHEIHERKVQDND